MREIFDDLAAEYERLDTVLASLTADQWAHPSACAGWSVSDVVLHLAQTEELVAASIEEDEAAFGGGFAGNVDGLAGDMVAAQRDIAPADLLARWRSVASTTPSALGAQPDGTRLQWVTNRMSPAALATTRLAEHWTHALDITGPLGIAYRDTARLRHIAWLGHRTLPYAFAAEGIDGGPVYAELTGPDGELWQFGDPGAASAISGPASDFCRVGARRLAAADSALKATGPYGPQALAILRNYAI